MSDTESWLANVRRLADSDTGSGAAVIGVWNAVVVGLAARGVVPDPRVNETAALGWQLIGSRVTPLTMGMGPSVNSVTFAPVFDGAAGRVRGAMCCIPRDWLDRVRADVGMQVGAVTFLLSRLRDFWNGRIETVADMPAAAMRAAAREGAVLRHLNAAGLLTPNAYQSVVLATYTDGAAGWYEGVPFSPERAKSLFRSLVNEPFREPTVCPALWHAGAGADG